MATAKSSKDRSRLEGRVIERRSQLENAEDLGPRSDVVGEEEERRRYIELGCGDGDKCDCRAVDIATVTLSTEPLLEHDGVVMGEDQGECMDCPEEGEVPADAVPDTDQEEDDDDRNSDGVIGHLDAEEVDQALGQRRE